MEGVVVKTLEGVHSIRNKKVLIPLLRIKRGRRATSSPSMPFFPNVSDQNL
jgi:hypothetical protein